MVPKIQRRRYCVGHHGSISQEGALRYQILFSYHMVFLSAVCTRTFFTTQVWGFLERDLNPSTDPIMQLCGYPFWKKLIQYQLNRCLCWTSWYFGNPKRVWFYTHCVCQVLWYNTATRLLLEQVCKRTDFPALCLKRVGRFTYHLLLFTAITSWLASFRFNRPNICIWDARMLSMCKWVRF